MSAGTVHAPKPAGTLNPGSDRARRNGCSCPPIDNQFGKGHGHEFTDPTFRTFVIAADCAMHGRAYQVPPFPLTCDACDADLEATETGIRCPNGCRDLPTPAPDPAPRTPRTCARCHQPIAKAKGRPPKVCDACLTPEERKHREYNREWARGRAVTA